jgi:nicotinamidase-related amidase
MFNSHSDHFSEKNLMPLTTLDPKTALIVVDLQKGIINSPFVHPIAAVIERNRALLDAFRQRDLPVVLVNVDGGAPGRTEQPRRYSTLPEGFSDLIPELARQSSDIVVTKRTWGAFEQEFNVTLSLDAMTDMRPEAHEYSLVHVFPRLGETGSTQDVLDLLATRSA